MKVAILSMRLLRLPRVSGSVYDLHDVMSHHPFPLRKPLCFTTTSTQLKEGGHSDSIKSMTGSQENV